MNSSTYLARRLFGDYCTIVDKACGFYVIPESYAAGAGVARVEGSPEKAEVVRRPECDRTHIF